MNDPERVQKRRTLLAVRRVQRTWRRRQEKRRLAAQRLQRAWRYRARSRLLRELLSLGAFWKTRAPSFREGSERVQKRTLPAVRRLQRRQERRRLAAQRLQRAWRRRARERVILLRAERPELRVPSLEFGHCPRCVLEEDAGAPRRSMHGCKLPVEDGRLSEKRRPGPGYRLPVEDGCLSGGPGLESPGFESGPVPLWRWVTDGSGGHYASLATFGPRVDERRREVPKGEEFF